MFPLSIAEAPENKNLVPVHKITSEASAHREISSSTLTLKGEAYQTTTTDNEDSRNSLECALS